MTIAQHTDGSGEPTDQQLVVVRVSDVINSALTGRDGCTYESPPQPREQAMKLVQLLLGYPGESNNGFEACTCPIAGGTRSVILIAGREGEERSPLCKFGHAGW